MDADDSGAIGRRGPASPGMRSWCLLAAVILAWSVPASAGPPDRTDLYGDPLPTGALARMGTRRFRVGFPATDLTFSPDGKLLVTATNSYGETIPVWEVATGKQIRTLRVPVGKEEDAFGAFTVAFSPDGKRLASANMVDAILIWDATEWRVLRMIRGEFNGIDRLHFTADGRSVAAACGGDQAVHVWNVETGAEVGRIGLAEFRAGALSPGGAIAAGYVNGEIRFWDVARGIPTGRHFPSGGRVYRTSFAPDAKTLTAINTDGQVIVWERATGRPIRRARLESWGVAFRCHPAFSRDNALIAAACPDASLRVWDATTGRVMRRIALERWNEHHEVALSPDGRLIASSSGNPEDTTVRVWDVGTGAETRHFPGHHGKVSASAFAPDGKTLASTGDEGTLSLWDASTGKEIWQVIDGPAGFWDGPLAEDRKELWGRVRPLGPVAFGPDGRTILTVGGDGTVRFRDAATGREVRQLRLEGSGPIDEADFSPDGRMIVAAWTNPWPRQDNEARDGFGVWSQATGKEIVRIPVDIKGWFDCLTFAPDGKTVAATCQDGAVRLWDLTTRRMRAEFPRSGGHAGGFAFSPDGSAIAVGCCDRGLCIWRPGREEIERAPDVKGIGVPNVAFSPDGTMVAWSGEDSIVRIWDVRERRQVATFTGHEDVIHDLTFTADSRRVATASEDGTVLIWDVSGPWRPSPGTHR